MSISISTANLSDDVRTSLLSNKIDLDNKVAIYDMPKTQRVGITSTFSLHLRRAIDDYISDVKSQINRITDIEVKEAFRGKDIENYIKEFVEGVRSTAESYCNKLQKAEDEIIESVYKAYMVQDSDISSDIKRDSNFD